MIAKGVLVVALAIAPAMAMAQGANDSAAPKAAAMVMTPNFRTFGVADGLPSNHVYKIVEDRKGFIWLGTRDGLARFDGTEFRVWRHAADDADSLVGNDVQAVYVDRQDRIWCGGDGGLSRFEPGSGERRDRFVPYRHNADDPNSLAGEDVWAIAGDADGAIWVGGYGSGVDRLDPATGKVTHLRKPSAGGAGLASDNVLALLFDRGGRLWIGTDTGIDVLAGNRSVRHVDFSAVASDARLNVTGLLEDSDGSLLAGTRQGLVRIGTDLIAHRLADHAPNDAVAYGAVRDTAGELWVGTRHGLNRMDAQGRLVGYQQNAAVPGSFPGATVFDAMRDHEGGLWFATFEGGIAYLSPQWRNFAVFRHDPGDTASLTSNFVRGLTEAASGKIWAVDSDGGIDQLDPATGNVERIGTTLPLPNKSLWSVFVDHRDRLWIGHGRGVRVYDRESGKFDDLPVDTKRSDALAPGMVYSLVQAPSGAIWAVSYGGGVQRIDEATQAIERFDERNAGLRSAEIDQIGFDRDGTLLAASGAGLDRFDEATRRFVPIPGAPSSRVLQFAFAPDGTLWLHTPGALEHYRDRAGKLEAIERIDATSGWPTLIVGGMAVDAASTVWVASPRGLWRFDPATRAIRHYDAADGLPSAEFSRMPLLKRRDGSLFGGTLAGVVGFVPERVSENTVPPRLAIESLIVRRAGKNVVLEEKSGVVPLAWGDRDLRIHAAVLSYANPAHNRYQWRLSGVDGDWVDSGNRGEREYAQVPGGRHTLRLRAANADGTWNELSPLHFDQPPPPWATRGAWIAYVLASILAIGLVLRGYRVRLMRRHALALAEQQRRFAEAASAAKTDFLATMGHEIRTPMTGVLGMTELLLRTPLDAKQRDYAEAIASSGQMMLRMVNDSLDLARIEAGRLELEDVPFDLPALIAAVAALVRPLAEAKGLAFEVAIDEGAARWVAGDAVRVKQIVLNLANNAIKFTERGRVVVELARAASGAVEIRVCDTGPGIAESTRARLFGRFEQVAGMQRRHGGSGLGLAICRELVARMGGEIVLDSREGEGSTFRVVLPLRDVAAGDAAEPVARAVPETSHDARGLHVLLVEDDATVAAVIVGLLQAGGWRVRHVENGLAALAEVDAARFDAALLDLDLPGLDGLALARALRAREARLGEPRLALIGISARSVGNEETLCLDAGMDAFLRKPIAGIALHALIERLTRAAQTPSPPSA